MTLAQDLFGEERPLPRAALRPAEPTVRLSLFDHAAETRSLETGRALSQERAEIIAPDDDFEDEDGPEYIDEGADVDAAWCADELLAEAAQDPAAAPEAAPVCDECRIPATIHEWASPHGREGFPCRPGSFERDRAAFEISIVVGDRRRNDEVTRVAYSRRTLSEKPEWYRERTRGDVTCYPVSNCYGTLWVERRRLRDDLFSVATEVDKADSRGQAEAPRT